MDFSSVFIYLKYFLNLIVLFVTFFLLIPNSFRFFQNWKKTRKPFDFSVFILFSFVSFSFLSVSYISFVLKVLNWGK
jgi:hypothetical protein